MIILEPQGGLANRMRVIASGIWLKEILNRELVVIWNENYEVNCPYDLLFEPSSLFSVARKPLKYRYIRSTYGVSQLAKFNAVVINSLIRAGHLLKEKDFHEYIWPGKIDILEIVKSHKKIYIQTCQAFGDQTLGLSRLMPCTDVQQKIDEICKNFNDFTIGVHIRRTDHQQAIKYSPIELFINKMNAEIDLQTDSVFFLCTDDVEVENELKAIFKEKIIAYPKEFSRQNVTGMQDAMIDLFCLSKTKKILGSFWSSFSEIASALNHTPLEVLKVSTTVA